MKKNSETSTKVGVWLPYRDNLTSVSYDSPGALVKEIQSKFLFHLRQNPKLDVIEFVDFRNAIISNGEATLEGTSLSKLDGFVWFGEIGGNFQREYNLEILKTIQQNSVVINNVFGYEIAMDKYLTSTFLFKNNIQVPKFMLLNNSNVENSIEEINLWKSSVLLKPRLGSYGIGITKIDKPNTLIDILDYMPHGNHYIEQLIPNNPADWIGINIINGQHAYSYQKDPESFHDGWKVMDRRRVGGKMILAEPTRQQLHIATTIARLLDMAWVGVDIITDKFGNPYVVDVNAFPGLYPEMFKAANVNGPKLMADAVFSKLGV